MNIGDKVKVLPPFDISYSDIYIITTIENETYFLEGIEGGFCSIYLEVINGY